MNGGGVRAAISSGDITYSDAMAVFPFANMTLVAEVTGQQILDMLETGAMNYPGEHGSFIQASGIEYTIDESIPSSVKLDETGVFLGVGGEYRVKNVLINGEPLVASKTYTLASHDYFLKKGGDGYIFTGKCNIIRDNVMSDSDLISVYIRDTLGGVIPKKYRDPYGEGRITILSAEAGASDTEIGTDEDSILSAQTAEDENAAYVSGATSSENPSTGAELPTAVIIMSLAAALISYRKYDGAGK